MNGKIPDLYRQLLFELRELLIEANGVFIEMSGVLLDSMMTEQSPAEAEVRLRELSERHCRLFAEVTDGIARLCPGKIIIAPMPKGNWLENMEQDNSRLEELEKIVKQLFAQQGYVFEEKTMTLKHNWRKIMENIDFKTEFNRKFAEKEKAGKRPNILIAGYTGCGKTSLIRTVLGGDRVPPEKVQNSKPQIIEFDRYEDNQISLWDSRGLELGELETDFCRRMQEFVEERRDDHNVDEHIHLVWYLIQGAGARVTESDLALLRDIFTADNVIAVVSKADIANEKQLAAICKILEEAGIPEERILAVSDSESGAIGCRELVAMSRRLLPEAYRDAFMAAQGVDREARAAVIINKGEAARELINSAIKEAAALVETPIPAADSGVLTPVALDLVAALLALYGLRDQAIREKAAEFVRDVAQMLTELAGDESLLDAKNAITFTGALGHYVKNCFESYALARVKGLPLPELGFDPELFKQFYQNYSQGMNMKPNILVCGKTGVGKTSLIQAVTHRGVVPDSAIGNSKATTEGFQLYETEVANFIDSEGMSPGVQTVDDYADFILGEVLERLDSDEKENLIHNIWYCIDGSGARIQDADAKLIKTFSDKVILVVTKCELMRKEQVESVMNTLLDLIDRDRIVLVSAENRTGLKQLIAKAETMSAAAMGRASEELEAFRNRWDNYYSNMRRAWTESVSGEADSYINWAAGRAAAIALVPLPLADVGPLIANEVYMLYKLAGVYGIAADNTVITMLLGCAGGSIAGKVGASFLPFLKVPIAAAVTYGVGKAAKAYFESGMTMNEDELRREFLAGEREAKKKDWKKVCNEE